MTRNQTITSYYVSAVKTCNTTKAFRAYLRKIIQILINTQTTQVLWLYVNDFTEGNQAAVPTYLRQFWAIKNCFNQSGHPGSVFEHVCRYIIYKILRHKSFVVLNF
jgi:hypothetical protein